MSTVAKPLQKIETFFSLFIPPTFPKYQAEWPDSTRTSSKPLNPPDYAALQYRYNPTVIYPLVRRVFPMYTMGAPRRLRWWQFWKKKGYFSWALQPVEPPSGKIFYLDQISPDPRLNAVLVFEEFQDLNGRISSQDCTQ